MDTMIIDTQIQDLDEAICRHISYVASLGRGEMSQDILKKARDLVEHIMCRYYQVQNSIDERYDYRTHYMPMLSFVKTRGDLRHLVQFHHYLEISESHYTPDYNASERLMLKYYEYFIRIKDLVKKDFNLDILSNLGVFPLNQDSATRDYYRLIAESLLHHSPASKPRLDRYYIQKIKPFFVDQKIYYEITYAPAHDFTSKSDHIIGFTTEEMTDYYAVKLSVEESTIEVLGKQTPIKIITSWQVAIRPCEVDKFISIMGDDITINSELSETRSANSILTERGINLLDLLTLPESNFNLWYAMIIDGANNNHFSQALKKAREIIETNEAGANVLRYLIYHLNNRILKSQLNYVENPRLSGLYLSNGCRPFDSLPYNMSPRKHNPRLSDLLNCINPMEHEDELLARTVDAEKSSNLFTAEDDLGQFSDIDSLINTYNNKLWPGHPSACRIAKDRGQVFINGYKEDVISIIKTLRELSASKIQNYKSSIEAWLNTGQNPIDDEKKKQILKTMFADSRVALVYGSAGTGKTRLLEHLATFFADRQKLFLAMTHPAVNNLRRRIKTGNGEYMTIAKLLRNNGPKIECDILIVDECSTVGNADMRRALELVDFKAVVLVGDTHQIESIRFGNWFGLAREFMPPATIFELDTPWRTTNNDLLTLWGKVRSMDASILETLTKAKFSARLDSSIFDEPGEGEVILCLNYDGLYGINNINRLLQSNNPSRPEEWGAHVYKIGDPILFNETDRFGPAIYNNLKGQIMNIQYDGGGDIVFDIEVNEVLNEFDASGFVLLASTDPSKSIIQFSVGKPESSDTDSRSSYSVVPFQIAYAISIHKAQGLEYSSVKVIITDEVDESITHNIFYTAITRARQQLTIYWSPEVEKSVLANIKAKDFSRDKNILRSYGL